MPYIYLDDSAIADIAFEATAETLEELFKCAADAVTQVMVEELETIKMKEFRWFNEENKDLELLLFDFLQEIIYHKDCEQLMMRAPEVHIEKKEEIYQLKAKLEGEVLDPKRHEQRVDVKAVTLHQFSLAKKDGRWMAHVILDI
jgi:SHS2 domain-containing protein